MAVRNPVDLIALILVIVGGLNWGLVGLFDYNLVDAIFRGRKYSFENYLHTCWACSALYDLFHCKS